MPVPSGCVSSPRRVRYIYENALPLDAMSVAISMIVSSLKWPLQSLMVGPVCIQADGWKVGCLLTRVSSHCPISCEKSRDSFCHISLTRLRHLFSVGCVGRFLWYFQSLLSKLLPTGIIRIYNIVYRMCFYSIIFIVSESFWSLQSIMLEVFYATVIIIIILVKTLYLTCS